MLLSHLVFVGVVQLCSGMLGSVPADPKTYPFLVYIEMKFNQYPQFGALLTLQWVLTSNYTKAIYPSAVYQMDASKLDQVSLLAGFGEGNISHQHRQAKEFVTNQQNESEEFSVVLIRADKPFDDKDPYVSPAKLPKSPLGTDPICKTPIMLAALPTKDNFFEIHPGEAGKLTDTDKSDKLKMVTISIQQVEDAKKTCKTHYGSSFCSVDKVGPTKENVGCPLLCNGDTIVAVNIKCDVASGGYSAASYAPVHLNLPFIEKHINESDPKKPEKPKDDKEPTTEKGTTNQTDDGGLRPIYPNETYKEVLPYDPTVDGGLRPIYPNETYDEVHPFDPVADGGLRPIYPNETYDMDEGRSVGKDDEEEEGKNGAQKGSPQLALKFIVILSVVYIINY